MKLLRYGPPGREKPGLLDGEGRIRDLSAHVADIAGTVLTPEGLAGIAALELDGLPIVSGQPRLGPCVGHVPKFVAIGLNYADHAAESGLAQPGYPALFARFSSSLIGHGAPILRPEVSEQLDYEGELVAVIGKRARDVEEAEALDHVAGYSIFNDASVRDYQFKSPQWTAGKNFDDTGAFGPCFVSADALPPGCKGLRLTTRLNGETVQSAMIDDMVFPVARLVSICSRFMTLEPGDVLVTGTPSGVGMARKPPLFMKHGDICEVEIDRIGILSNPVRDRAARRG